MKLIVVTCVTGAQGSSVAQTFLGLPEWKVRGITRNPSGEKAKQLSNQGVDIVKGDLNDVDSLIGAFQGAAAIFANTDFFTHIFGHAQGGDEALKYGFDREVEQGVNIAQAASSPAVLATLHHYVYSSLSDASTLSGGKITNVYHFDSKAETIRTIKSHFPEVAKRMSTLQMGHYVTTWKALPALSPQRQAPDGGYVIQRPFSADFRVPFVHAYEDTGKFVKALLSANPGKTMLGVSETTTFAAWTETWARVLGVKAIFRQVEPSDFFGSFPDPVGKELMYANEYMTEFGYTGGDPDVVYPKELDSTIRTTSLEEFMKLEDWSSVLSA